MSEGSEVGSIFYRLSIDDKDFQDKSKGAKDVINDVAKGVAIAGAALTVYAKSATDGLVDYYKASKNLSTITGESVTESSRLTSAFQKLGVDSDKVSASFGIFSKNIQKATDDSKNADARQRDLKQSLSESQLQLQLTTAEIAKHGDKTGELAVKSAGLKNKISDLNDQLKAAQTPFEQLGIATTDATGKQRDFESVLFDVADKFKSMPNGVEKTNAALTLFGRGGKDMIKVLNQGSDGIRELEREADRMGLTLNANTIGAVSKLIASQKELKESTEAMKIAVGTATAPVLTAFNQKINDIIQGLLNSDGPIRTITADFLAFGGPVLGAVSGLAAFAGNIGSALPMLESMAGKLGGITSLLTSPWVLAIAGAALAIGVLTDHFMSHKSASDELTSANQRLKASIDDVKNSQIAAADADLAKQGADLAVEAAQKNYTDAVRRFGPDSLEARQAAWDLANAKNADAKAADAARNAHDKYADSLTAKKQAIKDVAKASRELADSLDNVATKALQANQKISEINGRTITVKTTANPKTGVQQVNFLSTFGARAKGGPVAGGNPYIVGEEGPELYIPGQNGSIVPNNVLRGLMDRMANSLSGLSAMGTTITNHIGSITINKEVDGEAILARLTRQDQLISMGLTG